MDREAVYAALFERLQEKLAGTVSYFTRRLEHFENIQTQPAMLLIATNQRAEHQFGMPPVWTLGAEIYFYVVSSQSAATPETKLHELVDAVESALARSGEPIAPEWGVRLGSLVETIRLTSVEVEQGEDNGQAVAVVRLEMVAVSS